MKEKPDVDTGGGAHVEGNVSAGGDFVGRDKVTTTIFSGLARKQTYLLVATILLVTILLIVVVRPYAIQFLTRTAPPPDPAKLAAINNSKGLIITASAVSPQWLWLGVQKAEGYFLYKADSTKKAQTTLEPVMAVAAKVDRLTVDCYGNIWLLLKDVGTRVYDPTHEHISELLNRQTTQDVLSKNTMYSIATRCLPAMDAEVWLGREGVHTLRYHSPVTAPLAQQLLTPIADRVYSVTHTLAEVRDLLLMKDTLWVADRPSQQLLSLSPDGMTKPQSIALGDTPWSLASDPQTGDIWVGADDHLFRISKDKLKETILLAPDQTTDHILRASSIAVDGEYIWIGDACTDDSGTPCCPLASYVVGTKAPLCFGANLMGVNHLVLDEQHTLWIATNSGLFLFSQQ